MALLGGNGKTGGGWLQGVDNGGMTLRTMLPNPFSGSFHLFLLSGCY